MVYTGFDSTPHKPNIPPPLLEIVNIIINLIENTKFRIHNILRNAFFQVINVFFTFQVLCFVSNKG